ncbi:hypothetical protein LRS12_07235 [Sphingomonas sp. J344]|uniref:hypothetical protein n=1 Tax=Sphingomonas sp. J344 TaxID=2898434 RepID=UPI0021508669|nr:hypothetical protein [Sphingomonas sp. J344]MCR5870520.1 hypothetical protein [Sphingomonas sp. J344]
MARSNRTSAATAPPRALGSAWAGTGSRQVRSGVEAGDAASAVFAGAGGNRGAFPSATPATSAGERSGLDDLDDLDRLRRGTDRIGNRAVNVRAGRPDRDPPGQRRIERQRHQSFGHPCQQRFVVVDVAVCHLVSGDRQILAVSGNRFAGRRRDTRHRAVEREREIEACRHGGGHRTRRESGRGQGKGGRGEQVGHVGRNSFARRSARIVPFSRSGRHILQRAHCAASGIGLGALDQLLDRALVALGLLRGRTGMIEAALCIDDATLGGKGRLVQPLAIMGRSDQAGGAARARCQGRRDALRQRF